MSQQKPSNADLVRSAIETAKEEKIDLSKASNRKNLIRQIVEDNDHLAGAEKSLQGTFSNVMTAQAKAEGKNPNDFKGRPRPKFSSELSSSKEPNPVAVGKPTGYSPELDNAKEQSITAPGAVQENNPYMLNDKMMGDTISGLWEVIRSLDGNIESLDQDERSSLGGLWAPIIGDHINSKKSLAILAIGATAGTTARKIRKGRRITKAKKEREGPSEKEIKESKEKKEKEKVEKEKAETKTESPKVQTQEYGYPTGGEFTDYGV